MPRLRATINRLSTPQQNSDAAYKSRARAFRQNKDCFMYSSSDRALLWRHPAKKRVYLHRFGPRQRFRVERQADSPRIWWISGVIGFLASETPLKRVSSEGFGLQPSDYVDNVVLLFLQHHLNECWCLSGECIS